MKPVRATTFLIAFTALILLAAGTRNISPWRGLIQPAVAADSSEMTVVAVDPVLTPQGNLEYDTNRPGADYRNFELAQADPAICRNECANDSTCRAFTYVKPGVQGAKARCWLKSDVPNASANNCCVSGVKCGAASSSGLEVNVNRRGGDYRDYDLPSNNPNQCRDDCMNDSRCQSFTFLRPSYRGPNAHCFLKNSVPNATQETCCISGVKAGGGGGGGGATGWAGSWTSTEGGFMNLTQQGNTVTGEYGNGSGKVSGTVNGSVWTLTWARNNERGRAELALSADGRKYSGWWTYEGDSGRHAWSGERR
jgi:hypothetical protein